MPLLFAIAGTVALGLSFVVLVGPVLLVVAMIRAVRVTRQGSPTPNRLERESGSDSPVDGHIADAAFADLISREWPNEAAALRSPDN